MCVLSFVPEPYLTLTLTIKKYKAIGSLYHLYAESWIDLSLLRFLSLFRIRLLICSFINIVILGAHTCIILTSNWRFIAHIHCVWVFLNFQMRALYTFFTGISRKEKKRFAGECVTHTRHMVRLCDDLMKSFVAFIYLFSLPPSFSTYYSLIT